MGVRLENEADEYKVLVMLHKEVLKALCGAMFVVTMMVYPTSTFVKRLDFFTAEESLKGHREPSVGKGYLLMVVASTISE